MIRRPVPHRVVQSLYFATLVALTTLAANAPSVSAQETDLQEETSPQQTSNRELFADFLHNAALGKFERADAFARRLLANNPDPLEILKYADEYSNSLKTLILLVENVKVSDSAQQVLDLIQQGELLMRQDPNRIIQYIQNLGGDPQAEFNAIRNLQNSGEYAIPWIVDALGDSTQARLHSRIIRMLPRMGKEAVNPLVIGLQVQDEFVRAQVARALGQIGYPQALPYLRAVLQEQELSPELKSAVSEAILQIGAGHAAISSGLAHDSFLNLARQYYDNHGSVQSDPRFDFANLWYWRENRLERVEVRRDIYDEIMTMRCCQRALELSAELDDAIALWIAANIRREAELGMDVESMQPDPAAQADPTKPENFPRSTYFARAAGAQFCHRVLDIALQHDEPHVALGAVTALRLIAGTNSLVGTEDYKQPLAMALAFPDLVVRIKAALTLGNALPNEPFHGSDHVVPILASAVVQTGSQYVVVIDPDEGNLNRVMGALRNDQTVAVGETNYYGALERAQSELPAVSAIFLSSNVQDPSLEQAVQILHDNYQYSMVPLVLLAEEAQAELSKQMANNHRGMVSVAAGADTAELIAAWNQAGDDIGYVRLNPDRALELAMDAVETLRKIAFRPSSLYDASIAEAALIRALHATDESLQTSAAEVLAMMNTSAAQLAIAQLAMNKDLAQSLRVAAFDSLAQSAKSHGNLLPESLVDELIELAMNEQNLILRTAASQALGALDVPSIKAGQIIRKYDQN